MYFFVLFSLIVKGLTYEEIVDCLNFSQKTVEDQMGIALRKLQEYLKHKFT